MKEYKLAVIGATGLVGRKVIEVLQEYNLPISSCEFFATRKSAGNIMLLLQQLLDVSLLIIVAHLEWILMCL